MSKEKNDVNKKIEVYKIEKPKNFMVYGEIMPVETQTIELKNSEIIKETYIKHGQKVSKDQKIYKIESTNNISGSKETNYIYSNIEGIINTYNNGPIISKILGIAKKIRSEIDEKNYDLIEEGQVLNIKDAKGISENKILKKDFTPVNKGAGDGNLSGSPKYYFYMEASDESLIGSTVQIEIPKKNEIKIPITAVSLGDKNYIQEVKAEKVTKKEIKGKVYKSNDYVIILDESFLGSEIVLKYDENLNN